MQHRPLRPSPLAFSSHIEQQSPPGSSSPPAESPALSWSTSSMASSSSSSPTRSFYESSSFSTLQPHNASSGILPQPWRKHPSTPGTAKRKQAYKSTSSTRSQEQGPSSTSSSSPTFNLGSGSRWHSQFTQSCQQRAKQDRSKAIASRRNGYIGDYVDYDRETREEIAILRKLALRDKQKSTQDRVKENDMTQQQLDRLYELEAELAAMEERAAEQEMLQYQGTGMQMCVVCSER